MTNYNQLTRENRETIQILILKSKTFTYISKSINVDRTTISREIKRNRYIKSNFYEPFDKKGIEEAVVKCELLQKPPYICNNCPNKMYCNKHKLYYNAELAHQHAIEILSSSRTGVDISPEAVEEIENAIVPLIKDQKQSVNQVFINHSDILYMCKATFYNYVEKGVFSLTNLDLPKKVIYKVRKHKKDTRNKRELALLKNRTYDIFLEFTAKHPRMNIIEIDTVHGKSNENKVLFTLFDRKTHFMLIFLLEKNNIANVNSKISYLKEKLEIRLYAKVFRIFLGDNGSEFFDPLHFEMDYERKIKVSNMFYCNPNSPWQKNGVELNHRFIRQVFPKGSSFKNLTDDVVKRLQDNINAIPRESLNGATPFDLMQKKYPDLIKKLNCSYISPDAVDMSLENILGDNHE